MSGGALICITIIGVVLAHRALLDHSLKVNVETKVLFISYVSNLVPSKMPDNHGVETKPSLQNYIYSVLSS